MRTIRMTTATGWPARRRQPNRALLRLPSVLPMLGLLLLLSVGALTTPAHAQLTFTINPNSLGGKPGDLLSYNATLTNTGNGELFLNGDTFTLSGADLTLDDTPFFNNFPLSLAGGESASGELFTVSIGSGAAGGAYVGSFTVTGGATDTDLNDLATKSFSVVVSAPEPASGLLILTLVPLAASRTFSVYRCRLRR
jgi:hypothetical protein